jgi:hypothetical protein
MMNAAGIARIGATMPQQFCGCARGATGSTERLTDPPESGLGSRTVRILRTLRAERAGELVIEGRSI